MLTTLNIEEKGFSYYHTKESTDLNLQNAQYEDIYLALALIEKENKDDKEFPIQLEYNTSNSLFKIKTFYNNPKIYNEYFHIGKLDSVGALDDLINNTLSWKVKKINLEELGKYD